MFVNHIPVQNIPYNRIVKHTREGNIHEVMAYSHKSLGNSVHKLSAEHYYNSSIPILDPDGTVCCGLDYWNHFLKTKADFQLYTDDSGYSFELKTYRSNENRAQSPNEIRKTFKRLRSIINTNVTDVRKCKFITLTYAENMTDEVLLRSDLSAFIKRFKRYIKGLKNQKGNNLGLTFEYISVLEPQERGAWHAHIIFIFNKQIRYISNDDVYRIWTSGNSPTKRGFTTTRRIDNVDNVGAYLTAYLADVEVSDRISSGSVDYLLNESENINVKECVVPDYDVYGNPAGKKKKKFIKGGRLHLYPKGFHLYRCSQGIKRPEVEYHSYGDVLNEIGTDAAITFSKSVHISDGDNFDNTLTYMFFNVKRKSKRKDSRTSESEIIRCSQEFVAKRGYVPPMVFQLDSEACRLAEVNTGSILDELNNYNQNQYNMRC